MPDSDYHRTIAAWTEEHAAAFDDAEYPWRFRGRDHDGTKVKRWLAVAKGCPDRLRVAFRAYFAAVATGDAWPKGEPAQTRHFDRDVARWLRTDPVAARDPPESAARRTLRMLSDPNWRSPDADP